MTTPFGISTHRCLESPLGPEIEEGSPMMSISSARSAVSPGGTTPRPYVNKVGVLPSSLPAYHKDFIEKGRAVDEQHPGPTVGVQDEPPEPRTDAEKEEAARRLKPHARPSQLREETGKRPQGMTPMNPPKKTKPVRWQFGIRSRNAPWEALLCIHKALHKLGATYVPDEDYAQLHGKEGDEAPSGEGSFADGYNGASAKHGSSNTSMDPTKRYKLPADPWHINVRWPAESKSHSRT